VSPSAPREWGGAAGGPTIPFHAASIDEEDIAGVVAVLRSGWLTTGPRARAFEKSFAEALGGGVTALAVNSCTSGLHLALEALHVREGDLVLTTPYTFTATSEVIRYLGAHPVYADVDPVTGNLTRETVAEAFDRLAGAQRTRVKALVPVHFAGLPCDMTGLTGLAAQHGWAVVDDAAHALPAQHQGVPIGRWGAATAFSFYATKTLCTGEGGMVVTPHHGLAARMRTMRMHGIDRDAIDRYRMPDSWRYQVVAPGYKYNLPDVAAALGSTQLRKLHTMHARRAAVAAQYDAAFREVDGLAPPPHAVPGDEHAWHLYALRVTDGAAVRDELVRELARLGIGTSVHFIPLHLQPYYSRLYDIGPGSFPAADALFAQEVSLPLFPDMTPEQVARVVDAVPRALARARASALSEVQ
jgi:dTDP-4-amino-4,6-dideoxygalactose transaminase